MSDRTNRWDASGMQRVRVPLFRPTRNGLHFLNSWPSEPDFTLDVLGHAFKVGNARAGLCGGMAYTVSDCYRTGLLPPADAVNPAGGSPLFNYSVARLTNSFDEPDVSRYLSWIQLPDHDVARHQVTEEWPQIQAELDGGMPSALGLVSGRELPVVGFVTGVRDLHHCHQVLAWGYDLDGTSLTVYVYDPDNMDDNSTI